MRLVRAIFGAVFGLIIALSNGPRAEAQDVKSEFDAAAKEVSTLATDPAKLIAVRNLVSMQLEHRIATHPNDYESDPAFEKALWDHYREVLYPSPPFLASVEQTIASDNARFTEFRDQAVAAFSDNQAKYDTLINELSGALPSDIRDSLRKAMIFFAILSWARQPDFTTASWFTDSWVWPFCFRQQ